VVLGEEHFRRILAAYATYYNDVRTHLALGKDAPTRRPIQRLGEIAARSILGGLHHEILPDVVFGRHNGQIEFEGTPSAWMNNESIRKEWLEV
jgi:hypothetical protein